MSSDPPAAAASAAVAAADAAAAAAASAADAAAAAAAAASAARSVAADAAAPAPAAAASSSSSSDAAPLCTYRVLVFKKRRFVSPWKHTGVLILVRPHRQGAGSDGAAAAAAGEPEPDAQEEVYIHEVTSKPLDGPSAVYLRPLRGPHASLRLSDFEELITAAEFTESASFIHVLQAPLNHDHWYHLLGIARHDCAPPGQLEVSCGNCRDQALRSLELIKKLKGGGGSGGGGDEIHINPDAVAMLQATQRNDRITIAGALVAGVTLAVGAAMWIWTNGKKKKEGKEKKEKAVAEDEEEDEGKV